MGILMTWAQLYFNEMRLTKTLTLSSYVFASRMHWRFNCNKLYERDEGIWVIGLYQRKWEYLGTDIDRNIGASYVGH